MRLRGMGDYGTGGGESGDLFIVAHVIAHELFERHGDDLYAFVSVPDKQRLAGEMIKIPTLIDGDQDLKLPTATAIGTTFRIRNHGMPVLGAKKRGDLFVTINRALPEADSVANQAESRPTLRVFLCHSSGDKPAVRAIYKRLLTDGLEPWLDEEDLLPGQRWEKEIPRAVRACDVVLVCLSRSSINKKGYLQKEIRDALDVAAEQPEGTIFLIPLKLEECEIPDHLRGWQWVNFFEDNGYDRLMRALRRRMSSV